MDYKGSTSSLEQWVGLAVRRAQMSFRERLSLEDAEWKAKYGTWKAGARVKTILHLADTIAVNLSDDFLREAVETTADAVAIEKARAKSMLFFDYVERSAHAMAGYVSKSRPSAIGTAKQLTDDLRLDFVASIDCYLSKLQARNKSQITDAAVAHFYDEVLHSVQSRQIEIEEQFGPNRRGSAALIVAQVAFANDKVIEFLRNDLVRSSFADTATARAVALQLHSEAVARTYMGLRGDGWGGLRRSNNDGADVFDRKRGKGVNRIIGEIETTLFTKTKVECPDTETLWTGRFATILPKIHEGVLAGKSAHAMAVQLMPEAQVISNGTYDSVKQMLLKDHREQKQK